MSNELEKQVCSLKSSIRLKELGVKQVSIFYWIKEDGEFFIRPYKAPGYSLEGIREKPSQRLEPCSAFTVAELGIMLPDGLGSYKDAEEFVCDNIISGLGYIKGVPFQFINEC